MDRDVDLGLDRLDQFVGVVGRQQAGHVLDADGIGPHAGELFRHLDKVGVVMNRADGVADRGLGDLAGLLDRVHRGPHVAGIVEGVEDAEDIDAVGRGPFDEGLEHVIGIVAVAKDVLTPQQHLETGVGNRLAQGPKPLPGILLEESQAGIESRPAPDLQRPVADLVQLSGNRQHILGPHPGRQQRLVGIP